MNLLRTKIRLCKWIIGKDLDAFAARIDFAESIQILEQRVPLEVESILREPSGTHKCLNVIP